MLGKSPVIIESIRDALDDQITIYDDAVASVRVKRSEFVNIGLQTLPSQDIERPGTEPNSSSRTKIRGNIPSIHYVRSHRAVVSFQINYRLDLFGNFGINVL